MNEILGSNIMHLRKEADLTQEQLANLLGISYQAVSKWETGNSCPDISTLPLLADLFGVSIDRLFGRTAPEDTAETAPGTAPEPEAIPYDLPWPNDAGSLHVVLFAGHRLLGESEMDQLGPRQEVSFQYEGPALNIHSAFSVSCDSVQGDVVAGSYVTCDAVYGDVDAAGSVTCDDVAGSVRAGGNVTCDDVAGNVSAGGNVTCDEICGEVTAGCSVFCDSREDEFDPAREPADSGEAKASKASKTVFSKKWPFGKGGIEIHIE